jgi:CRP-like cAMP-binding protein
LALLTETVRPVTATAREPSTVLRIPRTLFLKMLEGYPDAAKALRDFIATRTDQSTREIYGVRSVLDDRKH